MKEEPDSKVLARNQSSKNFVFCQNGDPATTSDKRREFAGKVMKHQWFPSEESCIFCKRKIKANELPLIVHRSLYGRHSNSLNFYYTRELNKILSDTPSPALVKSQEFQMFDKKEECFADFYRIDDYKQNMEAQWRYHQFNIDQPRLFMKDTSNLIEGYFTSKRKLQDMAIRRMLELLSDSELERCELNLDPYMNEVVEFEEKEANNLSLVALNGLNESMMKRLKKLNRIEVDDGKYNQHNPGAWEERPSVSVSVIGGTGSFPSKRNPSYPIYMYGEEAQTTEKEESDGIEILKNLTEKEKGAEWPSFLNSQTVQSLQSKCISAQNQLPTDRSIKLSYEAIAEGIAKSARNTMSDKEKINKMLQKGFLKGKEPTLIVSSSNMRGGRLSAKKSSSPKTLKSLRLGIKMSDSKKRFKIEEQKPKAIKPTSTKLCSRSHQKSRKNISQIDSIGPIITTISQKTGSSKQFSTGIFLDELYTRNSHQSVVHPGSFTKGYINSLTSSEFHPKPTTNPQSTKLTHYSKKSYSKSKNGKKSVEITSKNGHSNILSEDHLKILNTFGVKKTETMHSKVSRKNITALRSRPTLCTMSKQPSLMMNNLPQKFSTQNLMQPQSFSKTININERSHSPSTGIEKTPQTLLSNIKLKNWSRIMQMKKNFITETEQLQQRRKSKKKELNLNRSPSSGVRSADDNIIITNKDKFSSASKAQQSKSSKHLLGYLSAKSSPKVQKSVNSAIMSTSNPIIEMSSPKKIAPGAKSRKVSPGFEHFYTDLGIKGIVTSRASLPKKKGQLKRKKVLN